MREAAATLASNLSSDPNVTVVPQTSLQFQEALSLYRRRGDKEWSLTDCASLLIMRDASMSEAFTHDRHFQQMGFTALLRESQ